MFCLLLFGLNAFNFDNSFCFRVGRVDPLLQGCCEFIYSIDELFIASMVEAKQ